MKTRCYFCGKHIERGSFDVMVGTLAFFLCGRHRQALMKYIESHERD